MRKLVLTTLVSATLGGCATGYAGDWFRDPANIIRPQLLRYGLNVEQSRCVAARLGQSVSRQDLRKFQEAAAAVRPATAQAALNVNSLRAVAIGFEKGRLRSPVDAAIGACSVSASMATAPSAVDVAATASPGVEAATGTAPIATGPNGQMMSGGVPVDMTTRSVSAGAATWLNLGAADSGQSIAIDAASIQQQGATRTAWFRMTDPQTGGQTTNHYRLQVDCQGKTIQPLALRQTDAAGAQVSLREYTPEEAKPGAVESGTVLEIAYLSLCT